MPTRSRSVTLPPLRKLPTRLVSIVPPVLSAERALAALGCPPLRVSQEVVRSSEDAKARAAKSDFFIVFLLLQK